MKVSNLIHYLSETIEIAASMSDTAGVNEPLTLRGSQE